VDDVWARRDYTRYAGPVAAAYGHSKAAVSVIIGPTGGGKSTESARRVLRAAQWQHRSPRDGLRKCRIGVIAPTYRRLWDQVIPSYKKEINPAWGLEPGRGGFTGAKGDPADHVFALQCPDGTIARIEVLFRAVGDMDLEEFFRGFEVTAWWLPEMDTHASEDILSLASNRVGRYPEPDDRPDNPPDVAYAGVWGDANAPEIDDWFYNRFWLPTGRKKGDAVFIQPGGFSAEHENRDNLRKINPRYYQDMADKLDQWAVRRLVENRPGYSRHGLPVHEYFDVHRMVTEQAIDPTPGLPLLIGADCGNTLVPAAAFNQRVFQQVRVMDEVVPEGQMDLITFAHEVRRKRETRFRDVKEAYLIVDPSSRAASTLNRQTSFAQILQAESGIEVILAPSNDPLARQSALDQALKRSGPPGEPGFAVDGVHCPMLVKALAGGYAFARRNGKQSPTPAKVHPWCDIAEAEQYVCLGMDGLGLATAGVIHAEQGRGDYREQPPILQE
jgi:hypothetical protein